MMRAWLYNKVRALPLVSSRVGVRVISSGSADNPATPFIVINMGVEQAPIEMPAEAACQNVPFTVQIHDEPGSMVNIDEIALEVKRNLPTRDAFKIGNLSVMEVRWTDTGQDGFDDHWGTNFRPVRFVAYTAH